MIGKDMPLETDTKKTTICNTNDGIDTDHSLINQVPSFKLITETTIQQQQQQQQHRHIRTVGSVINGIL
jgi:hypothetical protein